MLVVETIAKMGPFRMWGLIVDGAAVIPFLEEPVMSWCLRLIERVDSGDGRCVDVFDIGEIEVPTELAMLGLTTVTAKTLLAALQTEIVALQEAALTEAARRSPRPIKDHRLQMLQTPFGTVALRVPRLRGRGDDAKLVVWPRHVRLTPEFDRLRARLGA